jgi:hypothetical protein
MKKEIENIAIIITYKNMVQFWLLKNPYLGFGYKF